MLVNITIVNIALISRLEINFTPMLNVLSGETGAGKSIIIDSLAFVLGERADKSMIKSGCDNASVTAAFSVDGNSAAYKMLDELGLEKDTTIVLNRRLSLSGKNECRINGEIVTNAMLRQLSGCLVDIFGQSQHLHLLKTEKHIDILDDFSPSEELFAALKMEVSALKDIDKRLKELGGDASARERRIDLLTYQVNEICHAKLADGEEEQLIINKDKVKNLKKIVDALDVAHLQLSQADTALAKAKTALSPVSGVDGEINAQLERLLGSYYDLLDVTASIEQLMKNYASGNFNDEEINGRLDEIRTLKRKYGATVADVLVYAAEAQRELEMLTNAADTIAALEEQRAKHLSHAEKFSMELTQHRLSAAKKFSCLVTEQLEDLGMKGRFEVSVAQLEGEPTFKGKDKAEFLLCANKGEELKSLKAVASGGEMSRVMLAIKNITAGIEQIPTMVFDEIDTGISGAIAQAVAVKLMKVSRNFQAIVITHLPQVASMGDSNYIISKVEENGKTFTKVVSASEELKRNEINRLIGGNIGEYGKLHAKEMIDWADSLKQTG